MRAWLLGRLITPAVVGRKRARCSVGHANGAPACCACTTLLQWADDRHWFPILLDGGFFRGYFEFEKDEIVDGVLERTADADTALKAFGASK